MQNTLLLQSRQNQLVATLRIVQACLCLAAAVVEPSGPVHLDPALRQILTGYLAAAVLARLGAEVWRGRPETLFFALFAVDGLVFAAAVALTGGAGSPALLIFLLILLSAALQWGWRGAAAATAIGAALLAATGLPFYRGLTGVSVPAPAFLLRIGALLSAGGLLAAYAHHQEGITRGMLGLFGSPMALDASEGPPTFDALDRALTVFGLERGAFVWGDPEEPGLRIDARTPAGRTSRAWPIVAGESKVGGVSEPFFFERRSAAIGHLSRDGRLRREPADVMADPLLEDLADGLTLVLPVAATRFAGWIVLPAFPGLDREALLLGGVVATQAGVAMESWRSLVAWRDAAAAEERVRLARDIHDGALQFLAGAAMQLTVLARDLGPEQDATRTRIEQLLEDLKSEQRQLRVLIDSTAASDPSGRGEGDFWRGLQGLAAVLARRWAIEVSIRLAQGAERAVPADLAFELLQIVREAISNAVRHGEAHAVAIVADSDAHAVTLTIADNGVGMPAHGVFAMRELKTMTDVPRMLQARIAALGGELSVESGAGGVNLRIAVPLARAAP